MILPNVKQRRSRQLAWALYVVIGKYQVVQDLKDSNEGEKCHAFFVCVNQCILAQQTNGVADSHKVEASSIKQDTMNNIRIGADELILWLRKNEQAVTIPNDGAQGLGRKIYDLIISLGGKKIADDQACFWESEENSKNIGQFALPKTAAQYEMDVKKLPELFNTLKQW